MDGAQPYKMVSSLRLNEPIENFCIVERDGRTLVLVANGNLISICEVSTTDGESRLEQLCTIHAFQKPIMKIVYDNERQRIIAAGLDQQIKFFELFNDETEQALDEVNYQLRLQYKIKLPQAVMTFSISSDGQHYVIGLVDGSLIIKSKQLEKFEEEQDDEMRMIMNAF